MPLRDLSAADRAIVHAALRAIADGPFLDDDLHPRVGLWPHELRAVLARWPDLEDDREESDDRLAINNCLNEVCHGIGFEPGEWDRWFDVPHDEVVRVFRAWRGDPPVGSR